MWFISWKWKAVFHEKLLEKRKLRKYPESKSVHAQGDSVCAHSGVLSAGHGGLLKGELKNKARGELGVRGGVQPRESKK